MNPFFCWIVSSLILGIASTAPISRAAAPQTQPAPVAETMIDEIDLQSVPLDDVVEFLVNKTKGEYRLTVVREPGTASAGPLITLKARKVTLNQVIMLIQMSCPNVHLEQLDGPNPCNVLKVRADPNSLGAQVNVYRLSSALRSLAKGPDKTKEAMEDVLSLIKAAVEQAEGEEPVLKVHEETQTLLFKGTPAQQAALTAALAALEPSAADKNDELAAAHVKLQGVLHEFDQQAQTSADQRDRMALQEKEFRQRIRGYEEQLLERAVQIEQLKVRLELLERELEEVQHKAAPGK